MNGRVIFFSSQVQNGRYPSRIPSQTGYLFLRTGGGGAGTLVIGLLTISDSDDDLRQG